jgi:FKBP-type peptidyl-prolyl cis-trans isomerase
MKSCVPGLFVALSSAALFSLAGCGDGQPKTPEQAIKQDQKEAPKGPVVSELKVEDTKVGTGATAAAGDTLTMEYVGTLGDGKEFDSSKKSGRAFSFVLGRGEVIKGWDQGLVGMKVGGKRKLSIPFALAYGEEGRGTIPPRADLFFDVELVDIIKAGEEDLVTTKVLKPGQGRAAKKGDTVSVHYRAKTLDGKVFEDTRNLRKAATFTIGADRTMAGLEYGVIGMKKGATWQLRIPPKVGAQQLTMAMVPPNATIVLDVEMLDIK